MMCDLLIVRTRFGICIAIAPRISGAVAPQAPVMCQLLAHHDAASLMDASGRSRGGRLQTRVAQAFEGSRP